MKKVLYVDIDGVLAVFDKSATIEEVKAPGFSLSRLPDHKVIEAVRLVEKSGEDVRILGAAYDKGKEEEKRLWLKKHGLGHLPVRFVPIGSNKADYVRSDAVNFLLSDFTDELISFEKSDKRTVGIKYMNGINGTKGRWAKRGGKRIKEGLSALDIANKLLNLLRREVGSCESSPS